MGAGATTSTTGAGEAGAAAGPAAGAGEITTSSAMHHALTQDVVVLRDVGYLGTPCISGQRHHVSAKKTKAAFARVHIDLRTRQSQYLEYLAERDDSTLSRALETVIESAIKRLYVDPPMNAQKLRIHFTMSLKCIDYINLLASRWGLPRNDVVRRLIDDAAACDTTV